MSTPATERYLIEFGNRKRKRAKGQTTIYYTLHI